ncbi:hypothetical protein I5729_00480 [Acinetobacter bereziniae]|nr:hypothetical protein [Acinetobacter bereziniae]
MRGKNVHTLILIYITVQSRLNVMTRSSIKVL